MDSANHNRRLLLILSLIGLVTLPLLLQAKDHRNPYQALSKRNAFSLEAEPGKEKPQSKQEVKKPKDIKLTGIFQHNGIERAALAVLDPDGKLYKTDFLQLTRGEKQGPIQVQNIDRRNGIVTLSVNGVKRSLNFKEDAYAPATSRAARSAAQSQHRPSGKDFEKDKKEKKEKKSPSEKLAKINDAVSRGKMSKAHAELKAAVLNGELSSERAKIASFLEKGIIDTRTYNALEQLDNRSLKSSLSELKDARKLDKGKEPKPKKK